MVNLSVWITYLSVIKVKAHLFLLTMLFSVCYSDQFSAHVRPAQQLHQRDIHKVRLGAYGYVISGKEGGTGMSCTCDLLVLLYR